MLNILVKQPNTPESANTLKNLLLILGTSGTLNVQQLEPLILKANSGIARVSEADKSAEKPSYLSLFRSLNNHEVKLTMTFLMTFLKGIGEATSDLERRLLNYPIMSNRIKKMKRQIYNDRGPANLMTKVYPVMAK
ncbi:DUF1641 domain-containing protein [Peribacillus sp. NPDC060186]